MYFPNAFKKVYVAAAPAGVMALKTTGGTQELTAGQIGLFDSKTYQAVSAAGGALTNPTYILAQGSYHSVDKIGPVHGGYKESIKSKVINPMYISRVFTVAAKRAQQQIISISDLAFTCGHTYDLRVDVKGSPALRFANHNLYKTVSAYSGCCVDDCTVACNGDSVDQTIIMLQWADQINADPLLNKFIKASVVGAGTADASATSTIGSATVTGVTGAVGDIVSGSGIYGVIVSTAGGNSVLDRTQNVAVTGPVNIATPLNTATYVPVTSTPELAAAVDSTIIIEVAYTDTVFGNCTFQVGDTYDLEPLFVYASIVDETGNPCAIRNTANSAPYSPFDGVVELQAPKQAGGTGETVLRDLILFSRYLQDPFYAGGNTDSLRLREVLDDTSLNTVSRSGFYDQINILHNVPRLNNSTSIFDNDQYLLSINVPAGTDTTAFTALLTAILNRAGRGVVIETF